MPGGHDRARRALLGETSIDETSNNGAVMSDPLTRMGLTCGDARQRPGSAEASNAGDPGGLRAGRREQLCVARQSGAPPENTKQPGLAPPVAASKAIACPGNYRIQPRRIRHPPSLRRAGSETNRLHTTSLLAFDLRPMSLLASISGQARPVHRPHAGKKPDPFRILGNGTGLPARSARPRPDPGNGTDPTALNFRDVCSSLNYRRCR